MTRENVIPFAKARATKDTEAQFLELLDKDMDQNADAVAPLSAGLLDDIAALCASADEAAKNDLMEC